MSDQVGVPFGAYHLLRRLAKGGMAEVFLARQTGLEGFDRLVALKRILPHLVASREFVAMFLDEARLAAQLRHPNAVHIYDFGKVEDHYFIAMEYVDGITAGELIRRAAREPTPPALVARIGADACAGLDHAHNLIDARGRAMHLVHRDVSPPNLLLSYDGAVKLVDFGIAKAQSCVEQTRPGVVKGKYAYMSPEQTQGKSLDGHSDVFSLGIVLWEMLAGRAAVERGDAAEAMRTIRDGRIAPIESVRPDVPAKLAAALAGALHPDPAARSSALDFGLALEGFIKRAGGVSSHLELAQWVRMRFPRTPLNAETPGGTREATVATRHADARSGPTRRPASNAPGIAEILASEDAIEPEGEVTEIDQLPQALLARGPLVGEIDQPSFGPVPAGPTEIAVTVDVPSMRPRRRHTWIAAALLALAASVGLSLYLATRGPGPAGPAEPEPEVAAAATPEPEPEPEPEPATLEIATDPPGATVEVGDRTPARSPVKLEDLAPGRHQVRVSRQEYVPLERVVELAPGEHRSLELALKSEEPPPGPAADASPAAAEADAGVAKHVARPRRRPPAPGHLTVRTIPVYSIVYSGHRRLGQTPLANIELAAGTHHLVFRNPEQHITRRRTVRIRPGKTTRLTVKLR